jgi:hypothetical protein
MEDTQMAEEHPARAASQRSMKLVQEKPEGAREQWIALFADDGWIEDPVGVSPLDPEGKGHHGPEGIGAFWDATIATTGIQFELVDSFSCGNEVANIGRIHTTQPDGSTALCEGVFVYRVNDDGKLQCLRAFWEFDRMMATFASPPG